MTSLCRRYGRVVVLEAIWPDVGSEKRRHTGSDGRRGVIGSAVRRVQEKLTCQEVYTCCFQLRREETGQGVCERDNHYGQRGRQQYQTASLGAVRLGSCSDTFSKLSSGMVNRDSQAVLHQPHRSE